ncbi:MAG: hypothetical protein JWQ11_3618, partial [Rhizobacter sp.]|nr:hypothetical protein [Rhizobacter sp.]
DLAAAHVQALGTASLTRGLQFLNNVGLVRFSQQADGLHVSQALYSLRPRAGANEKGDAYVLHDARLEPVVLTFPTQVGRAA